MGCCGSTTTGAGAAPLDTGKRVNYVKGMLLGVDDFVQEQAWHMARRHELAREVLGYGTVRGLQVTAEGAPPRVRVTPGVALMPSGTPVCVPSEQCCDINAWLNKQWGQGVGAAVGELPAGAALPVYVVLAYDSALTDLLPVPGEPCRSEDDLTAASRIADCFRLELRLHAPQQVEENAIRDFADWLAQVPVDSVSPPLTEAQFLATLREAAQAWMAPTSPPLPGDFMFGTPPVGLDSTDALLRAALRLWVTELRPLWRARYGCGPNPATPGGKDDAVLLAALQLKLVGREAEPDVNVVEDTRPVLLSLRMLQELITQNPAPEPGDTVLGPGAFGDLPHPGHSSAYARADHEHGVPALPLLLGDVTGAITNNTVTRLRTRSFSAAMPSPGQVLVVDSANQWAPATLPLAAGELNPVVAETLFGQKPQLGNQTTLFARADHSHGSPALEGDAEAQDVLRSNPPRQTVRVLGLQGVPVSNKEPEKGHVLSFGELGNGSLGWRGSFPQAVPAPQTDAPSRVSLGGNSAPGTGAAYARADHVHGMDTLPAAGGDASGPLVSLSVTGLRGRTIDAKEPLEGQTLVYREARKTWVPTTPAGGPSVPPPLGGDLSGTVGDALIQRLQKVPVNAATPKPGDVLTFDGAAWIPRKGGGSSGAIELVAAGFIKLEVKAGDGAASSAAVVSSAGDDSAQLLLVSGRHLEVELTVTGNLAGAEGDFMVKLTPVWNEKAAIVPYLKLVKRAGPNVLQVLIVLFSQDLITSTYGVQYEISRYQPFVRR